MAKANIPGVGAAVARRRQNRQAAKKTPGISGAIRHSPKDVSQIPGVTGGAFGNAKLHGTPSKSARKARQGTGQVPGMGGALNKHLASHRSHEEANATKAAIRKYSKAHPMGSGTHLVADNPSIGKKLEVKAVDNPVLVTSMKGDRFVQGKNPFTGLKGSGRGTPVGAIPSSVTKSMKENQYLDENRVIRDRGTDKPVKYDEELKKQKGRKGSTIMRG